MRWIHARVAPIIISRLRCKRPAPRSKTRRDDATGNGGIAEHAEQHVKHREPQVTGLRMFT